MQVIDNPGAGMLAKKPRQVAFAGAGGNSQLCETPVLRGIADDGILHFMNGRMHMVAECQPRRELRVCAATPQINHHGSGNRGADWIAYCLRHDVQCQIDAGRDAGTCAGTAVFDEDAVLQHMRARRQPAQIVIVAVMRGALAAIQQAGMTGQ